jgi:hypothetical protein
MNAYSEFGSLTEDKKLYVIERTTEKFINTLNLFNANNLIVSANAVYLTTNKQTRF